MVFSFDSSCPQLTLFLHEDTLARMLAFELELAKQRLDSIASGHGDPGRPPYELVFEVDSYLLAPFCLTYILQTIDDPTHPGPISLHRCHSLQVLSRDEEEKFYKISQCPGIPSDDPFPIIRTLLSLPFSLLHTTPRLASMLPRTEYQHNVLTMGLAIIRLWFWDPPGPANIPPSGVPADTNWPPPVMDPSRDGDTFERWKSIRVPFDLASSDPPTRDWELPIASLEEKDMASDTTWSSFDYFVNGDAPSSSSKDDEDDAVPEAYPDHTISVSLWLEKIENSPLEVQEFAPSPYRRGAIGGMSMNDYLMVHGAIHPKVWLDFLDLSGRVVDVTQ